MYLTLGQAAKEAGKSKATISKYIKKGKLSVVSKDSSGYEIDPAELFRVFPKSEQVNTKSEQSQTPIKTHVNSALEKEIEILRERLDDKEDVIQDLRERLDKESDERRNLTLLITKKHEDEQKTEEKEKPKSFFSRLFG